MTDTQEIQKVTAWLEDTHIRRLAIPKRTSLHVKNFLPDLHDYLTLLEAPSRTHPSHDGTNPIAKTAANLHAGLAWLVDLAMSLLYADDAAFYNEPIDEWQGRCLPIVRGASASPEVRASIEGLLTLLGVPTSLQAHQVDDALSVCSDLVDFLISRQTADNDGQDAVASGLVDGMDLESVCLGFGLDDAVVGRFAKVMRVLHIRQLRELQNGINEVMADMQAVTANPKTNSKLGKVGR